MTRPEYAPAGLIALLTPQANTTVEPEFSVLMPTGIAWLNARMLSDGQTILNRLTHYMAKLDTWASQFGNAPIEALALGCTGTAYVVGPEREDAQLDAIASRLAVPVFSAATAVCDALECLQARQILLISPYDEAVHQACLPYWQARGRCADKPFEVMDCISLPAVGGFHPIYARGSKMLDLVLVEHSQAIDAADAVIILGTGMPTLAALNRYTGKTPLLSCMLCLGWKAAASVGAATPDRSSLLAWSRGDDWSVRLDDRLGRS